MELLEKPPVRRGLQIIKWILILALCFGGCLLLKAGYEEGLRYLSVRNKAVSVQAVVSSVEEDWDSESGTDYHLYVSYAYCGNPYTDHYDTYSSKKKANAMLGEAVTITINPERPTEQVKEIRSGSDAYVLFCGILLMCGVFCMGLREREWGVAVSGWYPEVIFQDVRGKALRGSVFWLGLFCAGAVWLLFRCLRPQVYSGIFTVLGAAALITGTLLLVGWIRRLRLIDNRQYIVGRDTLVNKTTEKDSDGDDTYCLHYTNGQKEWKRSVIKKKYNAAQVGTVIETVRLKQGHRPYLSFSRQETEVF